MAEFVLGFIIFVLGMTMMATIGLVMVLSFNMLIKPLFLPRNIIPK